MLFGVVWGCLGGVWGVFGVVWGGLGVWGCFEGCVLGCVWCCFLGVGCFDCLGVFWVVWGLCFFEIVGFVFLKDIQFCVNIKKRHYNCVCFVYIWFNLVVFG